MGTQTLSKGQAVLRAKVENRHRANVNSDIDETTSTTPWRSKEALAKIVRTNTNEQTPMLGSTMASKLLSIMTSDIRRKGTVSAWS
mmetsp:Transcript_31211/g.67176  ORF Transcript_31211/g.67176 Transcript_31211/m.67176 type:complete len:86 (-) Transcript_31211:241-498(-)